MRELFKPWRRKVGVVTLVLACAFAMGWVRSSSMLDVITCSIGRVQMLFVSSNHKFRIVSLHNEPVGLVVRTKIKAGWSLQHWIFHKDAISPQPFDLKSSIGRVDDAAWGGSRKKISLISYWTITLPLTLLSAYLLLSKPAK